MTLSVNPEEAKFANEVISKYQEHYQAWTVCDKIISGNCKYETKFFALRIMETTIREKVIWGGLIVLRLITYMSLYLRIKILIFMNISGESYRMALENPLKSSLLMQLLA